MRVDPLVRVGGVAAILAGLLRLGVEFVASGVVPGVAPEAGAPLYPWIDAFIALGLAGLMRMAHQHLGAMGWVAFALALGGLALIRATVYAPDIAMLYPLGAAVLLFALALFGFIMLRRAILRPWIGGFWIAAFGAAIASLAAGAYSVTLQQASAGFFSFAMIGLGVAMLRARDA